MSHPSEGDQRRAESSHRMWTGLEGEPSRSQPSRQGYCGYCRVLYRNLDQHLASLKHLDSVNTCCQGSDAPSTSTSGGASQTLMERFLNDVLQHHPHHYQDSRPSHADLPWVSEPPVPRKQLGEASSSAGSHPSCAPERLSDNNPHIARQLAAQVGATRAASAEVVPDWLAEAAAAEERGTRSAGPHRSPTCHRKAHRKTDRRKSSGDRSPPLTAPDADPEPPSEPGRHVCTRSGPPADSEPPSPLRPWGGWPEGAEAVQERLALSQGQLLERTIEEVIQKCCHGVGSTSCQEEMLLFSLPVSMETESDHRELRSAEQTPVQVRQMTEQHVSRLMELQVDLEDQTYAHQLDRALQSRRRAGDDARLGEGFWSLPIDQVLPAPEHIPESFKGKTWAQIYREDEQKVEQLVQQFRKETFICYFDSESLARFGRRSHRQEQPYEMLVVSDSPVLPLMDCQTDASGCVKKRKRRPFKMASRCQVVKVSHSTQTVQLVGPAVRPSGAEAPPTGLLAARQHREERTPKTPTRRRLPSCYSKVMAPVQADSPLLYLLCPPLAAGSPAALSPLPKRCRKKRRPLRLQRLEVAYKPFPLLFYQPSSKRVVKAPPEGGLPPQGCGASSAPPSCVRQLFRSLSPDLNAHSHTYLLKTLRRDAAAAGGQNRAAHGGSDRGRAFRTARTCLPTRKGGSQAPPTQAPGQAGPSPKAFKSRCSRNSAPFHQRGRSRGRSHKRRQR